MGKKDGKGKLINTNGEIIEGIWNADSFVGEEVEDDHDSGKNNENNESNNKDEIKA